MARTRTRPVVADPRMPVPLACNPTPSRHQATVKFCLIRQMEECRGFGRAGAGRTGTGGQGSCGRGDGGTGYGPSTSRGSSPPSSSGSSRSQRCAVQASSLIDADIADRSGPRRIHQRIHPCLIRFNLIRRGYRGGAGEWSRTGLCTVRFGGRARRAGSGIVPQEQVDSSRSISESAAVRPDCVGRASRLDRPTCPRAVPGERWSPRSCQAGARFAAGPKWST